MKIQSPWMGRIKGSAGNMTGCKVYDKNVMRAKAFEVSNPNTPAQQTQRNFFKELTALCTDFSEEQLRTLFPQKPKTMSRRNAIAKQISECYEINGSEKTIDYDAIDTLGNASVMDFGTTVFDWNGGAPTVTLDNSVKQLTEYANNYFFVVLVNVTKGEISMTPASAKVSVGVVSPGVPVTWASTDDINALPFITDSKIPLVGFGTLGVTKRQAHKND